MKVRRKKNGPISTVRLMSRWNEHLEIMSPEVLESLHAILAAAVTEDVLSPDMEAIANMLYDDLEKVENLFEQA